MATFVGTTGPDTRSGGSAEDYFYGDAGNDTLRGSGGNDILRGSYDNDVIYGGLGSDMVDGDEHNDSLFGDEGFDILLGDAGNDSLNGGAGNDVLDGGPGSDVLTGGSGAEHFTFIRAGDSAPGAFDIVTDFSLSSGDVLDFSSIDAKTSVSGGQSFTFIGQAAFTAEGQVRYYQGTGANDGFTFVEVNTTGASGAEMAVRLTGKGTLTADDFVLQGGVTNDTASDGFFHLTTGNDTRSAGGGNDYVYGDLGNDTLYGGGDSDIVRGGPGADLLDGGAGADALDGGPGTELDTFRFTGNFGDDILKDFHRNEDVLQIDVTGFNSAADVTFSGNVIVVGDAGTITLGSGVLASSLTASELTFI